MAAMKVDSAGRTPVYNRKTGEVRHIFAVVALEIMERSPDLYGLGDECPKNERIGAAPKAEKPAAPERSPEEVAEREEVIAGLRALGVKFFAGATTAKLKEQLEQAQG
jgi:hypothetical protein